jgi:F0F1-type ATP synthase delta subunit
LELKVDESILGGLQILVGDKFLDLSVRNRLAAYEQIFS